MDPNQNQPSNQVPSIKQPGNWSPLNDPSYDVQPPKKSFFSQYKKLIIISSVALVVLIGLAIAGAMSSPKKTNQTDLAGPTTNVELANYDKQKFSMSYAKGLSIALDEAYDEGNSWYLLFAENAENSAYNLAVYVTKDKPYYSSSEEGLYEQQDTGVELLNIVTSEVTLAGSKTQKSVGEITGNDGKQLYSVFSSVNIGDQYVLVTAKYPKNDSRINDSFDAMIGSIKLK